MVLSVQIVRKTVMARNATGFVYLILLLCVISAFTAASAADCRAQNERRTAPPPVQSPNESNVTGVLVEPNEDYRIGPGDVIEIQIDRAPELSGVYRVTAGGTFVMPYLNRVTAQKRTSEELAVVIGDGLRGRYLKDPIVAVTVKQINSHAFFIQGAVRRPGVYQIEGRPSLLKLITVAGGLADNHGSTAFVIRETKLQVAAGVVAQPLSAQAGRATPNIESQTDNSTNEEDAKYEMMKMNITGLLKGRFDQNMSLQAGDIINIPVSDVFFVSGEVREPGSFPLRDGTTLRQAISLAQGTTFKAAGARGVIFRENPLSGRREEIKVDIGAVMSGKKDDVSIMANDIVVVPNSRFKSVSSTLLTVFGMGAIRMVP
jgi:polysaccharide biosynthesis/export protein